MVLRLFLIVGVAGKKIIVVMSEMCVNIFWFICCTHAMNAPYCHLWHAPLFTIFPHYRIEGVVWGRATLVNIKCLSILSETFSILRRIEWEVMKNFMFLNVKFLLRLWYFNGNWIFSTVFQKILKNQILWSGIRIVTHGWTYILKVVVAFHIFANVHSDWNVGQCTCLCGICNKAYFVSTPKHALLGF